jgi:hypothetical protein
LIVLDQVLNATETCVVLVSTGIDGVPIVQIVLSLTQGALELILELWGVLLLDLRREGLFEVVL